MSSEFSNLVWEQKYRPSRVADTILPDTTKNMLADFLKKGNIPNFLFSGTSGTGKTTVARAIADELRADLLFINASKDGNIDTLRTTISQFVTSVSFTDSKKIVLLDESDHLNPTSTQPAMRGFVDEFSKNAIFILTCNFKHRIIAPLLSRFTVIDFKFDKTEKQSAAIQMLKRSCQILDLEKVEYDKKAVAALVAKNFPDFRKTISELQIYSASGKIDTDIVSSNLDATSMTDLFASIKAKDFSVCRKWVANNNMDSATFYRSMYDALLLELVPQTIPQVILHINDFQYQAVTSVDQEINQMAFIVNIMQTAVFK
jgi:DNA polymerase III delta prime subunit